MKKMQDLKDYLYSNEHIVVGHRGSSGDAPENTIASFSKAIDDCADMIEADIQMSRDGQIMVIHDKTLERTTNGSGLVKDFTLDELKKYDAGGWFDKRYEGERIPTLDELIELIKGKAYLNIEIKSKENDHTTEIIDKVIEIVEKHDYTNATLFASFNYEYLKYIKTISSDYRCAAVKIPQLDTTPSEISQETGCEGFICSVGELNDEIVADSEQNGIIIGVYSVDSDEELAEALRFNVKALATNFPAKIIASLKTTK